MDTSDTMTVCVRDRSAEPPWGVGLTNPVVCRVAISATCSRCGGRRGKPRSLYQCEDGVSYWVDVWDNPCGHVDMYEDVVKEARALAQALEERRSRDDAEGRTRTLTAW